MTINPYLNFNGNCEEAFNFYKSVFGGEFTYLQRFKDVPKEEQKIFKPEEAEKIMHVELPIGSGDFLMGSDTPKSMGQTKLGDHISISIKTESKEETEKLFNGLADGGKVTMPLADMFWGAYFGMCVDKFGVQWMVNFDQTQES